MSEECVYVIGTPGSRTVKIGRTINLAKRFADIQRMSPVPLEILWTHPGGHELETNLHRHFKAIRSHGEWFSFEGNPVELIKSAIEARPWVKGERVASESGDAPPPGRRVSPEEFAAMRVAAQRSATLQRDHSEVARKLNTALDAKIAEVEAVEGVVERYQAARAVRAEISQVRRLFVASQRSAVLDLKRGGLTWRQIGELLGVSGARAEQLSKAA